MNAGLETAARLGIAALIGLAAGLEREWSGHATGPDARFAGIRTFFLLGLLGGVVGLLADIGHDAVAATIALGASALAVGAYVVAQRHVGANADGTTEAAALVIVALGAIAGVGQVGLAAGAGAVTVLVLREKARLHSWVQHLAEPELRAGFQFAVLAVVVLPLLPSGPYLGMFAVEPRSLWAIVLVFCALNFGGFIARRIVGASRGLGITGALGGVVSSTAVTLSFSRQSRDASALEAPLARGVIAACTILIPRVMTVSALLQPAVARALAPLLLPAFGVGIALVAFGWGRDPHDSRVNDDVSPLRFVAALRMAVLFQVCMMTIVIVREHVGTAGLYATGAALGLTDVDALTVAMSRSQAGLDATLAAQAIAIGIIANTLMKAAIVAVVGRSTFRRRAALGLAGLAAASLFGLAIA